MVSAASMAGGMVYAFTITPKNGVSPLRHLESPHE
jgi:hypothetical protein